MHTSAFRGSLTVTSFRLCSRAPWTTSSSAAIAPTILLSERTFSLVSLVRGMHRPVRTIGWKVQVSKTAALLLLLICALALPSAALGAPGLARGTGVLEAGCPVDPVTSDVYCPLFPIWYSLQAQQRPTTTTGVFRTRWLVPGQPGTIFRGRVTCMNAVGNAVAVGGLLTNPQILAGIPFVEYAVDNGTSGDLVSDLGLFPEGDPDFGLLPVGFPTICPAPGLTASIYGYLPVRLGSGGVFVRPPS
jgi:hypothetical protein